MPIVNTMAFLFTVLGEWWVEGKVISRGKCNTNLLADFLRRNPAYFGLLTSGQNQIRALAWRFPWLG